MICKILRTLTIFNRCLSAQFKNAIGDAEKLVSGDFLGLRCLLNDDFVAIGPLLKQISTNQHPLRSALKNTIHCEHSLSGIHPHSLFILLISRLLESKLNITGEEVEVRSHQFAEMAEMIYLAGSIHRTIQNVTNIEDIELREKFQNANKVAVLIGDYLFAQVNAIAAATNSVDTVASVSAAISEISRGVFLEEDLHSSSLSLDEKIDKWKLVSDFTFGSPLGNLASAMGFLAGASKYLQEACFSLARNLALSYHINCMGDRSFQLISLQRLVSESLYPDGRTFSSSEEATITSYTTKINCVYVEKGRKQLSAFVDCPAHESLHKLFSALK